MEEYVVFVEAIIGRKKPQMVYVQMWKNRIKRKYTSHYQLALKPLANYRTGNLSRFTEVGKGVIGQWIIAKTLNIKDLNIENSNFRQPVDISEHPIYGRIEAKIQTKKYGQI